MDNKNIKDIKNIKNIKEINDNKKSLVNKELNKEKINENKVKNINNNIINKDDNKNNDMKTKKDEKKNKILDSLQESKKQLLNISKKIEKIDSKNVSDDEIKNILKLIDKEVEVSTERMVLIDELNNDTLLKEDASVIQEFLKLNKKLFDKVSLAKPFESFFYSEDKDKEKMIKEFFDKINDDINWFDLDEINFNSDYKTAINEKNNIISNSLIDVLESNLNVNFTSTQKASLKKDFSCIAGNINKENLDAIKEECEKIKNVSNIKLISRPSYKNFISKNELKKHDSSKKLSTIRVDFLNYITLNKKDKVKSINENLEVQLKSIKEILEQERDEYSKKMKLLFLLILMSTALIVAAPAAGATGVIAIGSAAAYMQTKVIMNNNKIRKIKEEIKAIKNGESEIAKSTYEKLEETSKELLNNPEYSETAKLYIKKKKESLKAQELKEKVEEQMRLTILDNLEKMSESKKDKIVDKVKDKYNVKSEEKVISNDKEKIKDANKEFNFDVELAL